jgi:TP901 family phage tail tape measure protein
MLLNVGTLFTGLSGKAGAGEKAVTAFGAAAAGLAVTGLAAAIKSAADFQTQVVLAGNNAGMTAAQMGLMSQTVLKLGSESNVPLGQLITGFRDVMNSGFSARDAVGILTDAMMSAASTGADTGMVASVLAGQMHEFGLSATQAGAAMNVLHVASTMAKATLSDFATYSSKAAAMGANLHVPLVQVDAALMALSRHMPLSQAATALSGELAKIANPAKGVQKELAVLTKQTGIDLVGDFSAAGLASRGLTQVLDDVSRATHGNVTQMLQLIPATRGGLAAMILTGSGLKDYKQGLTVLNDTFRGKVNPTLDAFRRIQQTLGFQFGLLFNDVSILGIALGQIFLPPLESVTGAVGGVVNAFAGFVTQHTQVVGGIAKISGAFLLLGPGKKLLLDLVGDLFGLVAPFAVVGLAATGLYLAWSSNFAGIQTLVTQVWTAIQPVLTDLGNMGGDIVAGFKKGGLPGAWSAFVGDVPKLLKDTGTALTTVATDVKNFAWTNLKNFAAWVQSTAPTVASTISGWASALAGWAQVNVPKAIQTAAATLNVAWTIAGNVAKAIGTWLGINVPKVIQWTGTTLSMAWKIAGDVAGTIGTWLGKHVPRAIKWAGTTLQMALDFAGNLKDAVVRWLGTNAPKIINWTGTKIQLAIGFAGTLKDEVTKWLATHAPKLISWAGTKLQMALGFAGNLKDAVVTWLTTNAPKIVEWTGTKLQMALGFAGDLKDAVVKWLQTNAPTVINWTGTKLQLALGVAGNIKDAIVKWLGTNAPTVINWAGTKIQLALDVAGSVATAIQNWWNTTGSKAANIATGAVKVAVQVGVNWAWLKTSALLATLQSWMQAHPLATNVLAAGIVAGGILGGPIGSVVGALVAVGAGWLWKTHPQLVQDFTSWLQAHPLVATGAALGAIFGAPGGPAGALLGAIVGGLVAVGIGWIAQSKDKTLQSFTNWLTAHPIYSVGGVLGFAVGGALGGPFGAVLGSIAGVVIAVDVAWVWQHQDAVKAALKRWVKAHIGPLLSVLTGAAGGAAIGGALGGPVGAVVGAITAGTILVAVNYAVDANQVALKTWIKDHIGQLLAVGGGVVGGALIGGALGGPVGAVVGAVTGGIVLVTVNYAFSSYQQPIQDFFNQSFKGLTDLIDLTSLVFVNWKTVGADLVSGLVKGIKSKWNDITKGIKDSFNDFIWGLLTGFWGIASPSTKMAGMAGDLIQGFINGLKGAAGDLTNNVGIYINDVITAAISGVSLVGKSGSAIKDALKGVVGGLDTLVDVGKNLVQGLQNGITQQWGQFYTWLKGKITGLLGDMLGWLGIGSPSRITADMGTQIMRGFITGMQKQEASLAQQVRRVSGILTGGYGAIPGAAGSPQAGQSLGLASRIQAAQNTTTVQLVVDGKVFAQTMFNYAATDRRIRPDIVGITS